MNTLNDIIEIVEEYMKNKPGSKSKKLFKKFLIYVHNEGYSYKDAEIVLLDFVFTHDFQKYSKSTQSNYVRDLREFIEYLQEDNNEPATPSNTRSEKYKKYREQYMMLREEELGKKEKEAEKQRKSDEEYNEFLRRYDELCKKQ